MRAFFNIYLYPVLIRNFISITVLSLFFYILGIFSSVSGGMGLIRLSYLVLGISVLFIGIHQGRPTKGRDDELLFLLPYSRSEILLITFLFNLIKMSFSLGLFFLYYNYFLKFFSVEPLLLKDNVLHVISKDITDLSYFSIVINLYVFGALAFLLFSLSNSFEEIKKKKKKYIWSIGSVILSLGVLASKIPGFFFLFSVFLIFYMTILFFTNGALRIVMMPYIHKIDNCRNIFLSVIVSFVLVFIMGVSNSYNEKKSDNLNAIHRFISNAYFLGVFQKGEIPFEKLLVKNLDFSKMRRLVSCYPYKTMEWKKYFESFPYRNKDLFFDLEKKYGTKEFPKIDMKSAIHNQRDISTLTLSALLSYGKPLEYDQIVSLIEKVDGHAKTNLGKDALNCRLLSFFDYDNEIIEKIFKKGRKSLSMCLLRKKTCKDNQFDYPYMRYLTQTKWDHLDINFFKEKCAN